jgi:two-component system, cell cycle sensor histidine kinase and response regulator CckA
MSAKRPKTVVVPRELEPACARAEEVVSRFFAWRVDPEQGLIELSGERYVLVRAASLSIQFFALVRELYGAGREQEADRFARNLLFDLAHAVGKADAQTFHAKMNLADPISRLSAGPVHFAHTGWASVVLHAESRATLDESQFRLIYDHPSSFESDAWARAGEQRDFPVCIMSAGYSSGWSEESFGMELVASEVLCRARGDAHCRFVMAPPSRIEEIIERYIDTLPGVRSPKSHYEIPNFFARKRAEEELRRSHAELEERVASRTAELQRSNQRLRAEIAERERVEQALRQAQKLDAVGRLAGGIAHDFNNLMGTVTLRAARLKARLQVDSESLEDLEEIEAATARAAALTKQLLTFSRGRASGVEPIDLSELVADLARTLLPLLGEDVLLELDLADASAVIEADPAQLDQVVMNLVVNAREAMPSGGRLVIRTQRVALSEPIIGIAGEAPPGTYALLEVSDQGIGMTPAIASKIFEPFFTTKDPSRRTGLGLATVFGVVQESGGQLQVDTHPDRGTRFSLYFPASERRPAAPAPSARPSPSIGGTETILVVEDQPQLRLAVREILHELGYTVMTVGSPAAALELAEKDALTIDLLVTDVVMPGIDGRELARRMRAHARNLSVLYISGYVPQARLGGNQTLDAEFLAKPFTAESLARSVRRALEP